MTVKHPLNQKGQKYHDFEVVKYLQIPELQCELIELVHLPTGAHVMHLATDDPENLFCLSFQTIPDNSDGVAHILEHTVLCGSEKFPIKDPFFAMTRRSLNTYMNALTGSDFTCYPAATQVPKDFYNLLDVYIDAVFKPNLKELSFLQEGHRLEFSIPKDVTSPLEIKGIVFNEMKGALSSASSRLGEALNKALFPDIFYGYNSGGDPKEIPTLTYEKLRAFHQKYYHPSHCLFFFYGNMPLTDHLDFIAERALKDIKPLPPLDPIPKQPRLSKPARLTMSYPISEDEEVIDKTLLGFGWLTCSILNQEEILALYILEIVLMDTDASPLKMALLKSGLCKQASCYLDSDITEVPFIMVLKGCNPEYADDIEAVIRNTLTKIAADGIPFESIENAIHQLEFYRSEITGDQYPFGLSLFMRSALLKQHGANPEQAMTIHTLFDKLRKHFIENPKYLTDLINQHLLNNSHFVRIEMNPDKTLEEKELAEEKQALAAIKAKLTNEDAQNIIKKSEELIFFQREQEEQDRDILPKVGLEDIPPYARYYELQQETVGNLKIFHHNCFTNKIVYADIVYDLPMLAEEDLPYVRLFAVVMPQLGCGKRNYMENLEYIQANTGGVHVSLTFNLQAADHHHIVPSLYIRGKALDRKAHKLFPLLHEMITSTDFTDISRLKEIIHKHYTALNSSLNHQSLKYATNLSACGLSVAAKMANAWYGLDYYYKIRDLAQNFDDQAHDLRDKLLSLKDRLLCLDDPHLILSCDAESYDHFKGQKFYGLDEIDIKPFTRWNNQYPLSKVNSQGRIIASPIAFTSIVFETVSYTHPDSPALNLAGFLFDNLTLHAKLREQGGAYGGGAVANAMSGNFYFYSYRDPNIYSSVKAFEESVQEIIDGNFDEDDLEEAKLEMVQGLDSPVSPGSRADLSYGWMREGKTPRIRQDYRDRLLALTKEDIIKAVKNQIVPKMASGALVAFAGKDLLEKENAVFVAMGLPPLPIEKV